jgi:hypothetical protein
VEVQYPLTLAKALIEASKKPAEHVCHVVKIRFLFISGWFSVRDQGKHLWMLEEGRKARVCSTFSAFALGLVSGHVDKK